MSSEIPVTWWRIYLHVSMQIIKFPILIYLIYFFPLDFSLENFRNDLNINISSNQKKDYLFEKFQND